MDRHLALVSLGLLTLACPSSDDGVDEDGTEASSTESGDGDPGDGDGDPGDGDGDPGDGDGDPGDGDGDPDPNACWRDLGVGEHEVFTTPFAGGTEGAAFGADGFLYVTTNNDGDGTVWRVDSSGVASEFATLPYALGLAPRSDGGFVVASIGETNMADGAVYSVDAMGAVTQLLASGIDSPNFVAMAPDGSALVSDDFDTRVFRVTAAGELSVVIADVASPNGMAYSPDGAVFYVASTFTATGELTRYDVDGAGLPIEASGVEILHLGMASTPDGIAVDADGWVYVAANLPGEIWRVDGAAMDLQPGELVAGGLSTPASLAFGHGPDFDPCSLYVTSLLSPDVVRVHVGVPGVRLPTP